ncbi:hypothetical protein BUALT_Bualt15G0033400 [Buddleja alternifolia]|uniref:La-related protein 6C n=1 Tax=Buddleja alternifolia TaxID=168488 RepID=A0AAV6WA99_9LAMI|nr:hypothetical protein BUALT_Bualt15G0033400 [Buddleja alternifolia]
MAQARREDHFDSENRKESGNVLSSFKFNAAAPEFVPGSHVEAPPVMAYVYPYFQYNNVDGSSGSWIYVADQDTTAVSLVDAKAAAPSPPQNHHANAVSDELKRKIIKQAEYMFSDMSVLVNESFAKHVSKDPEGFVPINFITTTKKLKSLNVTNQMVAQALRFASNLVLSNDGKKVRRKYPFTDKEREDLQLRTVIAENLPDDHSHQSIDKLFNVVGSIKTIRICQPQDSNSSRSSKGDSIFSNKLHALVEYENPETAEKAAEKLNDERNWRKGLRVRVMLKRSPKSVLKSRKSDFDVYSDDEELHEDASRPNSADSDENLGVSKTSWLRNRGKAKNRPLLQSVRSLPTSSTSSSNEICKRQMAKGPRMPDGTRGFTMGRGKPLSVPVQLD